MTKVALIGAAAGLVGLAALALGYQAGRTDMAGAAPDMSTITAATTDRAEIEGIVRNYLINNPEVMIEVQTALNAKQEAAQKEASTQVISENKDRIFLSSMDAVFGNPNGDVTIVEFFDYNCGYCKKALPDMDALLQSDPNLRFVMKEFPILGADSTRAHMVAKAFKAVMPEKYLEFHRDLLGGEGRATEESAMAIAVKLGANETQIREKMKSPEVAAAFRDNYDLANSLSITGTPSYVVGNEVVPGALGADALAERISQIRNK
ncbi:disulfide bond formation protein DsbA [Phyllobacterium brassicacearum]|uniref:Disulfide bond formation protein DsbA n=1 Tax=Phyllobacterium brassicacearum TaxID=314235 RepID=A0A2P7B7Y0_9HYPH|nr:DsbA family protein [Phyllobacterium brassicacearum]PSH62573.1 disulfide bond formation protein DsbA [Phyllobacterium brassicacearum]TDQ17883.1 protein-disulfide isomerase [Phyllobacterium brassicacearum]